MRKGLIALQIFLVLSIFSLVNAQGTSPSLRMVHVLYRHGEKTPDPSYFIKLGLLTQGGKRETFELGEYLRKRYKDFLNLTYDVNEVEFVSSAVERAVQSAELVTYGLYKEYNMAANWSPREKIPYDPIPIQTIPEEFDRFLQATEECPRRDDLKFGAMNARIEIFARQYPDIVSAYVAGTGDTRQGNPNLSFFEQYDPLLAYFNDIMYKVSINATVPDWTLPLISNKGLTSLLPQVQAVMCGERETQRLTVGPLLKMMVEHMNASSLSGSTVKKLYSYASHDTNLVCYLSALGFFNPNLERSPPTSSAIILELHSNPIASSSSAKDLQILKVYFLEDKTKEPEQLQLPGCPSPCLYATFLDVIQDVIPQNYEQECRQNSAHLTSGFAADGNTTLASSFFLFTIFLVATVLGVGGYRKLAISRGMYKEI